jgi:cytochrome d ubiquinol oxidase subunit I
MNLGTVDILNLFINRLALGFMAIAFISHYIGIFKKNDRYFRLAKPLILVSLIIGTIQTIVYFYFLSMLRNGIPNFWILMSKLQPGVIGYSMDFLLLFLVLGAIYYAGFNSNPGQGKQGWNVFIGILAFVAGYASDVFYTITESYTMGPTPKTAIRTPMSILLSIEKNIQLFALSAAVLAIYAAIRYIMSSKKEDKEFYDWMGSFASIITVMFLIAYPIVYFGWFKHYRATASHGFNRIMLGKYQWIMYDFLESFGAALILNFIYMLWKLINGRDKSKSTVSVGLIGFLIIVAIVSLIFGALPLSMGVLGNMQPVKYLALTGLFLTGFMVLGYYLKDLTPNFKFGNISKIPQLFLIAGGLLVAFNVPLMGYMKIMARGKDRIIYQTMNLNGTKYVAPVIYPWPVKKGYGLLHDKCVICHTLNRVERYNGKAYGPFKHLVEHQMRIVNGCPITLAEAKEVVHYLDSLNIIAYNQHLAKEHKKWTPPASLPWGKPVSSATAKTTKSEKVKAVSKAKAAVKVAAVSNGVALKTAAMKIIDAQGCLGCHTIDGKGGAVGPNLSQEGNKGHSVHWIEVQIQTPKVHDPSSIMPDHHLNPAQLRTVATYIDSLK